MKRWSTPVGWMRDDPEGEYVEHDDALDELASLRDRLAKAEADRDQWQNEHRCFRNWAEGIEEKCLAASPTLKAMFTNQPKGTIDAWDELENVPGVLANLEAAMALAVAELHNIANSRPHEWPEETRNQFQPWAQSRARHAIAAIAANPLPEAPRA